MTIAEATALFLNATDHSVSPTQTLALLSEYFSPTKQLHEIASSDLRGFLSRYCVEHYTSPLGASNEQSKGPRADRAQPTVDESSTGSIRYFQELLDSLKTFFEYTDRQAGTTHSTKFLPVLAELRRSMPRALEISRVLSRLIRERGGAFTFPEFLTSFEEGGSSQYDIDVPGNVGAIDGYFGIIRVQGSSVEARELISEERVWPIRFPPEVAELLEEGYIINLELVRDIEAWQIVGCGFAYPPGTEF